MPELPEVETIVRGLREKIIGHRIENVSLFMPKILRCAEDEFVRTLQGKTVQRINRRGKFILIELSRGWSLVIHLKMTGQLTWTHHTTEPQRHTHVIFHLSRCPFQLHYCDMRQFGYIFVVKTDCLQAIPPLRDLGPEPLAISESEFVARLGRHKGRIKSLLMNQNFLAGLGNIYTDESLWLARIHPLTAANRISTRKARSLREAIRTVLTEAITHGGSTVDDYRDTDGLPGQHQFHLRAYGREGEPCLHCGRPIRRSVIGGRSSYLCPRCQRQP